MNSLTEEEEGITELWMYLKMCFVSNPHYVCVSVICQVGWCAAFGLIKMQVGKLQSIML